MTRNTRLFLISATAAAAAAAAAVTIEHARAAPVRSDAQLVADAASAAPAAIGRAAAVVAPNGSGGMRTLRRGSNGWTCMPDEPNTPDDDPMCVDRNGLAWAEAWMGHRVPLADRPGLAYMLRGAADASNTDPYAAKPAAGAGWVRTGPHIMILDRNAAVRSGYPGGPHPDTSRPYVMFAGTPYAHIMMPVR
jgi:hypothetical protein